MERRYPFVNLTLEEIRDRLRGGGARPLEATPVEEGRCNTLYRLRLEDGREALWKLYVRDSAACGLETDLLGLVAGRVPVAPVLARDLDARPAHALLGWVEGENLERILPGAAPATQEALGRAVGETLAAIHAFTFDGPGMLAAGPEVRPLPGANPFTDFIEEMLAGRAGERLGAATAKRLAAFAAREGARVEEDARACRLVHGDFNPSNILVRREGGAWRVAAVVDWEWSVSLSPLMDLGNILRDRGWPIDPFRAALLAAYRERAGNLPEDWPIRSDILELTSALEFLSQPQDRPTIQGPAADRIRACLDRWS